MNTYAVLFEWGEFHDFYTARFTADAIANELMGDNDDIMDFKYDGEPSSYKIWTDLPEGYELEFDDRDPRYFSVYKKGVLAESNVRWHLLKVYDDNGNVKYNLTDRL